jgi:alkyl hydroperoxide reductase subunit AhpC
MRALSLACVAVAVVALLLAMSLVDAACPFKEAHGASGGGCPFAASRNGGSGSAGSSSGVAAASSSSVLKIGKPAPSFDGVKAVMPDGTFKAVSLSDYKDKWVVLFFYPLAFTFVCPTEILTFAEIQKELGADTQILGVSVDSQFSIHAWTKVAVKDGGLGAAMPFPLLSDITKDLARRYNVLIEEGADAGVALRGTFIIDPKGTLRQFSVNDLAVSRNVADVVRLVRGYQHADLHGEVCPSKWKPGDKAMKPDPVGSKEYFEVLAKELAH